MNTEILQALATWLHTLAFVIVMGYYGVLGRIVLPALERSLDGPRQARALLAIERRALPLVLISLVLFTLTGSWLLVTSSHYAGLGVFGSSWTWLMLVKHLFVGVFIVLGVMVDILVRRVGRAADRGMEAGESRLVALCAEGATACGAIVILLTAAAQVS